MFDSFDLQEFFGFICIWIVVGLLFADEHEGHEEGQVDQGETEELPRRTAVRFLVKSM